MRTDSTWAIVDATSKVVASFGTPQTNGNQGVGLLNTGRYLYQVRPCQIPHYKKLSHSMHARHWQPLAAIWCIRALLLLLQGYELFSADLSTFLIPQPDGNLVLYNTALVNQYGRTGNAALYGSGSYTTNPVNPYYLTMQTVSSTPAMPVRGVHADLRGAATARQSSS
jgi:hypothetical protein